MSNKYWNLLILLFILSLICGNVKPKKSKLLKFNFFPACLYFSSYLILTFLDCGHEFQDRGFAAPKIAFGEDVKRQLTVSIIA